MWPCSQRFWSHHYSPWSKKGQGGIYRLHQCICSALRRITPSYDHHCTCCPRWLHPRSKESKNNEQAQRNESKYQTGSVVRRVHEPLFSPAGLLTARGCHELPASGAIGGKDVIILFSGWSRGPSLQLNNLDWHQFPEATIPYILQKVWRFEINVLPTIFWRPDINSGIMMWLYWCTYIGFLLRAKLCLLY